MLHEESKPEYTDVKLSEVPLYLREGAFYRSFGDETEGDMVSVPCDTIKPDLTIAGVSDVAHALTSLRFWGVDGFASEVVDFVLHSLSLEGLRSTLREYELNFPYLKPLGQYLANPTGELMRLVVQSGSVELLQYLHENGHILSSNLTIFAAQQAHKSCLVYLLQHGCACDYGPLNAASAKGDLDCFILVYNAYRTNCPDKEVRWAVPVTDENIDCFLYAYHNTPPALLKASTLHAMMYKGADSIKYGHEHGLPLHFNQLVQAVKNNDFAAFQLLHALGCPWNNGVTTIAAKQLKLNFLVYAMQHGCHWNRGDGFARKAASNNRLDCLEHAHQHGCYWSESTTHAAASHGHLECLIFAHEHGCPWDGSALDAAVKGRHLQCVRYLLREGCPWDKLVNSADKRKIVAWAFPDGLVD